jgi:hypothetical protein
MATQEQLDDMKSKLMETLNWYKECNLEKLRRTELGEKLSFDPVMPDIERVVNFYRKLLDCDLSDLPHVTMNQVVGAGLATIEILKKIGVFDPEKSSNPFPERQELMNQIRNRWEADFPAVSPILAYSTKSSADFQRLEREARGTLSQLSEDKKDFTKETTAILEQMKSALNEVQDAAKNAGVSQHAVHFNDEAGNSKIIALCWLGAAIVFGFATISYIIFHVEPILSKITDVTALTLIQTSIPRLIIVFVLTYGMIWSARNFSASIHNFVVNRHRSNALASFKTFVESTSKPEIKDAVLMQATHAIFMPQDSGYTKSDPQNPTSQVVEVYRGLGKD